MSALPVACGKTMRSEHSNSSPPSSPASPCAPPPPSSPLLALPPELLIAIIDNLSDDNKALCSLAQVSRRLQPMSEEHIYAKIEILSTDDLRAILYAFSTRSVRVSGVKTLKILYKHHDALSTTLEERVIFNNFVGEMKLLQDFHIESPYDNFQWEAGGHEWVDYDMEQFRKCLEGASLQLGQTVQDHVGLSRLEKLVIHSHGAHADYWELDGFHCLFRHPSLRVLHVSCVTLPSDLPELESFAAQTPLTTLVFDECELKPQSLERILATPKSLKHLTLGENVCNTRRGLSVNPRLSRAPYAALQALMQVSHSLETLTHLDPQHMTLPDPQNPPPLRLKGSGMRDFHHLKFLECDPCSFLHQGIILNRELVPPNLETIRLHQSGRWSTSNFWDHLPDQTPYTKLPSLKLMEFVAPTTLRTSSYMAEYICHPDRLRERHSWAFRLWVLGIGVKMYAEVHMKYSFIPPYLYGEAKPELLLLYDSYDVGFQRKIVRREEEAHSSNDLSFYHDDSRMEMAVTDQLSNANIVRQRNQANRVLRRHRMSVERSSESRPGETITAAEMILELLTGSPDTDSYDSSEDDDFFGDDPYAYMEEDEDEEDSDDDQSGDYDTAEEMVEEDDAFEVEDVDMS